MIAQATSRIDVGHGKFAIVDQRDFPWLSYFGWHLTGGYVQTTVRGSGKARASYYMHRMLMQPPANLVVDHINGDPLDNRRENLRVCTSGQNIRNSARRIHRNQASRFKGVQRSGSLWIAAIGFQGAQYNIGSYPTEHAAACAYNECAIALHGPHAQINDGLPPVDKIISDAIECLKSIEGRAWSGVARKTCGLSHCERKARRKAMSLSLLEGNSFEDVAKEFGVTTATVRSAAKEFSTAT